MGNTRRTTACAIPWWILERGDGDSQLRWLAPTTVCSEWPNTGRYAVGERLGRGHKIVLPTSTNTTSRGCESKQLDLVFCQQRSKYALPVSCGFITQLS